MEIVQGHYHLYLYLYLNRLFFSKFKRTTSRYSPIASHPACEIITSFLGLHKDDRLVFFLGHNLLHKLDQPVETKKKKNELLHFQVYI